ncbi:MAG: hypothetical protein A2X12_07630 [Bacteroidetes bacterium GWE2_29_8]|nr:MAG: hypothetical protein A2X12_07630 [Bacteroidetes bacterium GWE2_29_8]OFY22735.1 MAG: hypothetical protein A2X02_02155 [Bacteroidetes bacterium GWF2_29_10]
MDTIKNAINTLSSYIEREEFKGYDPYDSLNSPLFKILKGNVIPAVFTQIQKRNAFNIRPLIGVHKEYNPKGIGLLLSAYCKLYKQFNDNHYLEQSHKLFEIIKSLKSEGYSGAAWGYNFDWVSISNSLPAYAPSAVVTSFVIQGIYEYFTITGSESAKEIIISSADFIIKDLPINKFYNGKCIAYTKDYKNCCYNASLLGAEILAIVYKITNNTDNLNLIDELVNSVVSMQKENGVWFYDYNLQKKTEKKQIDFHQGFVLNSISNIIKLTEIDENKYKESIVKGLDFYYNNQFNQEGKSLWRIPKEYPVDIHNQSQGIITFATHKMYNEKYLLFARKIADWTIDNMQDKKGYFYYKINRLGKNKISFMRWSQAWMLLALSTFILEKRDNNN